jgi:hypothetical protein
MPAVAVRIEQALRPLDELRRIVLRLLAGASPLGRALAQRRSLRLPALLSLHALLAFALAVLAPSFLLAVAPLAVGVPHLASDVRHLLVRRPAPRWWLLASATFMLALLVFRIVAESGHASLAVEQAVASAWVLLGAAGGATLGARARIDVDGGRSAWTARGWGTLAVALAIAAFAAGAPSVWRLVLLHGHNLIAIVVWLVMFRRGGRLTIVFVALALAGGALLASGALLGVTIHHGALSVAGLHLFAAADWLAPGLPDERAIAVATSFAFLQSVHYAIWLVAIPGGDRPGDGARAWRNAFRDLARDLRPAGLLAVAALTLLVAVMGLVHAAGTRRLFLSLGTFHGWLELAVLAFVVGLGPVAARPAAAEPPRP